MYQHYQLWQRCADWLIRLSVLPANHVVVGSSGTLQDLAYTLRDGVVLCHVALALDPQVSQAVPIHIVRFVQPRKARLTRKYFLVWQEKNFIPQLCYFSPLLLLLSYDQTNHQLGYQ